METDGRKQRVRYRVGIREVFRGRGCPWHVEYGGCPFREHTVSVCGLRLQRRVLERRNVPEDEIACRVCREEAGERGLVPLEELSQAERRQAGIDGSEQNVRGTGGGSRPRAGQNAEGDQNGLFG